MTPDSHAKCDTDSSHPAMISDVCLRARIFAWPCLLINLFKVPRDFLPFLQRTCATRSFSCARMGVRALKTSAVSARRTLRAFCANSRAVTEVKSATVPAGSVWAWHCSSARSSPSCWAPPLPEIPLHHQQRAQRGHDARQRSLRGAERPAGDRERETETPRELEIYGTQSTNAPQTYSTRTKHTKKRTHNSNKPTRSEFHFFCNSSAHFLLSGWLEVEVSYQNQTPCEVTTPMLVPSMVRIRWDQSDGSVLVTNQK